MNTVRTFIICSSITLAAWLGASYTSKVDAPSTPNIRAGTSGTHSSDQSASRTTGLPVARLK